MHIIKFCIKNVPIILAAKFYLINLKQEIIVTGLWEIS